MYQKRCICICTFLPRARPKAEVEATELVGRDGVNSWDYGVDDADDADGG